MDIKPDFGLFDTVEVCCSIYNRTFRESGISKRKIKGHIVYCKLTRNHDVFDRVTIYNNESDMWYIGSGLKILNCRIVLTEKYCDASREEFLRNHNHL